MKLTRKQLRKIINESISINLNEAQFTTKGLGSFLRYGGGGLGAFLGSFGTPAGTVAGGGAGFIGGDRLAKSMGYEAGKIPVNHPLALPNLVQYIEEEDIQTPEALGAYIESITQGKYGVEYDPEDFDAVPGSEQAEQLLNDLGGIRGGIGKFLGDKADALANYVGINKFFADSEVPQGQEQSKDAFINPPDTLDDLEKAPSKAQRMKAAARRKQGRRF